MTVELGPDLGLVAEQQEARLAGSQTVEGQGHARDRHGGTMVAAHDVDGDHDRIGHAAWGPPYVRGTY